MNQAISFTFLLVQCHLTLSDFIYADFNKTTGLVFNGAASPTACEGSSNVVLETNSTNEQSRLYQYGHTATTDVFSTVETIPHNSSNDDIAVRYSVFGHRLEFDVEAATTGCRSRLRLTPSHPSKAGSVWYDSRVPVVSVFDPFDWKCIATPPHTFARRNIYVSYS
jgi:hypothetical protein